jgi:uncharacterized protein
MSATVSVLANASAGSPAEARIAAYDWQALTAELDGLGCAVFPKLLTPKECRAVAGLYPNETLFRSHIIMARHGFGKGEYRYCKYPLPDLLAEARTALYPGLAAVANEWNQAYGLGGTLSLRPRFAPEAVP